MTNAPLIELSNIGKCFRDGHTSVQALRDVSLAIEAGDSVAITGRSGAGKSTLLQILAGLIRPTEGQYFFEGREIDTLKDAELFGFRRQHIGFVPQSYALLEEETVRANVSLPMRLRRWDAGRIDETAAAVLTQVDLTDKASTIVHHLSGGQKQRVALARAMCTQPEVILADEPTAALDPESQREMIDCLWELRGRGTTIIMVTHDPVIAARCSRAFFFESGTLADAPSSLRTDA